ncbi:MAG: DNA polymerase-3 subunit epsilon [Planctomycetota bacterium]
MSNIYSVVDVETTGGKSSSNRITEIAIVKTDGYKIIDQYSSLVNPHRNIDKFVVQLTGITDRMVAGAPDFADLIDVIEEFTKDTIFVAHNVAFDYSILKKEYKLVNKIFKRNKLCTVQLSRKTLKEQESFSLGKLTTNIGIELVNRHRALGDADATAKLLHYIIDRVGEEQVLGMCSVNNQIIAFKGEITNDIIEELPEESGTFSFLDKKRKVIYIGYAKNIFSAVTKFLIEEAKTNAHHGLYQNMFSIEYEVFNSFFITQLSAISEIVKHKPTYNKSKDYRALSFGIFEKDNDLIKGPFLTEHNKEDKALWRFSNMNSAKRYMKRCLKMNKLKTPIFNGDPRAFDIAYKENIEVFLKKEIYAHRNFFVVRTISYANIAYVVWVKDFIYQGYGKIDLEFANSGIETLKECIKPKRSTQAIQKIIKKYVEKARGIKVIPY